MNKQPDVSLNMKNEINKNTGKFEIKNYLTSWLLLLFLLYL